MSKAFCADFDPDRDAGAEFARLIGMYSADCLPPCFVFQDEGVLVPRLANRAGEKAHTAHATLIS